MTLQRDRELRFARDRTEQQVSSLLVEQLLEARAQGGMVVDDEYGHGGLLHLPPAWSLAGDPGNGWASRSAPPTTPMRSDAGYGVISPRRIA